MTEHTPILALDVDGVLIEGFPRYRWDIDMLGELGIEPERMQQEFFQPYWQDVMLGRTPVEQPLKVFLEEYPSDIGVAEFLAYWHGNDAHLRPDVVAAANRWRQRSDGKLALATNQDLTRAEYLINTLGLGESFEAIVASCHVGAAKPTPDYFIRADELLERRAGQEVFFLDDLEANVAAAKQHGWLATHVPDINLAAELIDEL